MLCSTYRAEPRTEVNAQVEQIGKTLAYFLLSSTFTIFTIRLNHSKPLYQCTSPKNLNSMEIKIILRLPICNSLSLCPDSNKLNIIVTVIKTNNAPSLFGCSICRISIYLLLRQILPKMVGFLRQITFNFFYQHRKYPPKSLNEE